MLAESLEPCGSQRGRLGQALAAQDWGGHQVHTRAVRLLHTCFLAGWVPCNVSLRRRTEGNKMLLLTLGLLADFMAFVLLFSPLCLIKVVLFFF